MTKAEAPRVHLIERVHNPIEVYREICSEATSPCIIVDLSAGRSVAVSPLSSVQENAPAEHLWIKASDFANELAEPSRSEYVQWVSEVGDQVILEGKSIKEWFVYDDEVSLWWLTFTAQKNERSSPYRWLFYGFALIDYLFEGGVVSPDMEWVLWVPDEATGRIVRDYIGTRGRVQVCSQSDESGEEPGVARPWHAITRVTLPALRQVSEALRLRASTRLARRSTSVEEMFSGRNARVLVDTLFPGSWREVPAAERFEEETEVYDGYLGAMPWTLQEHGIGTAWLWSAPTTADHEHWRREWAGRQSLGDASPWATIGPRAAWKLLESHHRWARDYAFLFEQHEVHRRWLFRGVDLSHWIRRDYELLCSGRGVWAMIKLEQYRAAEEALQPDAVIYRDEMYITGRILSAALKGRSRLIGVQHGIIDEEATVYRLDPRDVPGKREVFDATKHCPVPDVFAVFGDHVRQLLDRWGGYDAVRVIAVGGVRHDNLVRRLTPKGTGDRATRTSMREQLCLPVERPVVLLCTQLQKEAGAWFDLVVEGLEEAGVPAFIAVKTHHYHGGETAIQEVAERRGFTDYGFFSAATYPLVAASDVVVGGASTIIIEARLLNTPAITISSADHYEAYPYKKEGLGVPVRTSAEMAVACSLLLGEERAQETSGFHQARRALLRRHLWNYDAGACQRLAAIIEARDSYVANEGLKKRTSPHGDLFDFMLPQADEAPAPKGLTPAPKGLRGALALSAHLPRGTVGRG